jgi:2,3-dihydroxybenzoate decarboxylase
MSRNKYVAPKSTLTRRDLIGGAASAIVAVGLPGLIASQTADQQGDTDQHKGVFPMEATSNDSGPLKKAKRIALEEHFVINEPEHIDRWLTLILNVPPAAREKILPILADTGDKRLEAMSKANIDVAVLSNVGTVQGTLDPTPALRLARQANDALAAVVAKNPTRYAGFATVPLQEPKAGAEELERAVTQLGMKGTLIIGHTNGRYLDDERFLPFWERAEALQVPVYLHAADAMITPATYAGRSELIGATWSWTAETAAHTLRLIFGDVFQRFPKTRLLLGHMGETLPYLLWRLDQRSQAFGGEDRVKPSEIFRKNISVTTAGVFSDEPLMCAIKALGEDSIMFSVDHPFENMERASEWFDRAPISDSTRIKLSQENARRFLKL